MKTAICRKPALLAVLALAAVASSLACRNDSHPPDENAPGAPASSAAPVPLQAGHAAAAPAGQAGELPPGHPPIDAARPPAAQPASGGELTWTAPAGWVSVPPANNMRLAQYRVPSSGGDAELVVFYFGPGQGGDPQSNAERWASQFIGEDGKPATASLKTRQLESNGVAITVVEARGTYQSGGMMGGTPENKPGYALLGAIAAGPDSNWFFKLTGPEATVEAQRAAFDELLRSLRPAAS